MIEAIRQLLQDDLTVPQQVALLKMLTLDKLTAEDLTASAELLLQQALTIPLLVRNAVDVVGTGGDGSNTFNISTTAALVAAAAGVKIVKHGNKAITSRSGSFDLLQALGVKVAKTPKAATKQLVQCGVTFLFAPYFHPVLRKIAEARKVLSQQGIKTIFNVLGPLVNPMQVKRQALGVFLPQLIEPYVRSLQQRKMARSLVFHGDGLDELSLCGVNQLAVLHNGNIEKISIDVQSLGLRTCTLDELRGGDAADNAAISLSILQGKDRTVKRDVVLLNAAAAIIANQDGSIDFASAIQQAAKAVDDGSAMKLLEKLRGCDVDS